MNTQKRLLGWEPKVRRQNGLAKTLNYFSNAVKRFDKVDLTTAI